MVHLGSKLTQFTVLSFKSNNHIFQIAHSHLFLQRHSSGENQRMLSPEKNLILQGNNIIKVKKPLKMEAKLRLHGSDLQ